ncbi:MAG: hypothetical protein M3278_00330 [Thermoproteota archaeon]|nr:hypothetical protein [Thermoproteota archaeon]
MLDSNKDKEKEKEEDRLILGYDTIVRERESALLTTTGGILFGFLLSISINTPEDFSLINRITLLVALYSITIAISLFVMPVSTITFSIHTVTWRSLRREAISL